MFCSKCGKKAIENANFCRKCGAPLMKDGMIKSVPAEASVSNTPLKNAERSLRIEQTHDPYVSAETKEAYVRLKEQAPRFAKVKKISIAKSHNGSSASWVEIKSVFYNYKFIYSIQEGTYSLFQQWNIMTYLIVAPIVVFDALFLFFLIQLELNIPISCCCLAGCLAFFVMIALFIEEKKDINAYVNSTFSIEDKTFSKKFWCFCIVGGFFKSLEMLLCVIAFFL